MNKIIFAFLCLSLATATHLPAIHTSNPYNLQRFVTAQDKNNQYATALTELKRGKKQSHWMWYIFPQMKGLGHSATSEFYGITCEKEALHYLNNPILGIRLRECCKALLTHVNLSAKDIFGDADFLKLWSSMTLFAHVAKDRKSPFNRILERYFNNMKDSSTLILIKKCKLNDTIKKPT